MSATYTPLEMVSPEELYVEKDLCPKAALFQSFNEIIALFKKS